MILILSDAGDNTTVQVMRWLDSFSASYTRINLEDEIRIQKITNDCIRLIVSDEDVDFEGINSVWYRRGTFNMPSMISDERIPKNVLRDFQDAERKAVEEYLHYKLREKKSISSYLTSFCNKLIMLDEAQKIGLKVPPTLITGNSGELLKKYKGTRQGIINKPIGIRNSFNTLENVWSLYTNEVEESSIVKDTHFFPSLFQTKIKKRYEIRTFILHNRCWSMAIFSQGNPQTEVDFRHYDVEKPNRRVPYTLPGHIEAKLIELCKKLGLNSGSADFIVGEDMDFYFLEINPVGQFGFVSYNCNYAIEKEIALNLIGN